MVSYGFSGFLSTISRRVSHVSLVCAAILLCGLTSAFAQTSAVSQASASLDAISEGRSALVRLTTSDLRQFDAAFDALSRQAKVTIIAEGRPYQAALSADAEAKLKQELPADLTGRFDALLPKIAAAYDYEVAPKSKSGALLLFKRYSDRRDLPGISCEEAEHCLKSIVAVAEPFNPHAKDSGRPGSPFDQLWASLSETQRKTLFDKAPVSSLTENQRHFVYQIACQYFLQNNIDLIAAVLKRLSGLHSPKTEFCWMDGKQFVPTDLPFFVFGYEGPFGWNGMTYRTPLSHGFRTNVGGATSFAMTVKQAIAQGISDRTGRLVKVPLDTTAPDTDRPTEQNRTDDLNPSTVTLQKAVAVLTTEKPEFSASVDSRIAGKTITIFNGGPRSPDQMLSAFSEIFGLRVAVQDDRSRFLTLRQPRVCKQITDIPTEVERLLPVSFLRAITGSGHTFDTQAKDLQKNHPFSKMLTSKLKPEEKRFFEQGLARNLEWTTHGFSADAMNQESVRRLRLLVEPKVPKGSGKRLPVVQTGEEEHRALAIFHLTQAAATMERLAKNQVPPHLQDFSRAWVTAYVGKPENPNAAGIGIGIIDEAGIFREETGGSFSLENH